MLRLDPLSEQAAGELLSTRLPPGQAQEFVTEARRRGIAALLDNPLTLILLAGAVGHGDAWPRNRLETFEMACKEMATEQNDGHRAGAAVPSTETVVDAAGHLCALQLLAGIEGYSLAAGTDVSSFVTLDTLEEAPGYRSRASLENALGTKLFRGAGDRTCSPLHRHVAEFLAGRYLAKLIRDGLPASRVVALMTGPSDGRVGYGTSGPLRLARRTSQRGAQATDRCRSRRRRHLRRHRGLHHRRQRSAVAIVGDVRHAGALVRSSVARRAT